MHSFARDISPALNASELLDAMKPRMTVKIALVEDDARDAYLFQERLKRATFVSAEITHFSDLEAFLACKDESPDVIVLDRFIQRVGLTEGRIRQPSSRHPGTGIIMYTGCTTPKLRSSAVQEGAFAVVEKGSLSVTELELLLMTAACVGSKISNHA